MKITKIYPFAVYLIITILLLPAVSYSETVCLESFINKRGKIKHKTAIAQDADSCPKKFIPLINTESLSVEGIQGPSGPQGAKGDPGEQGPQGEKGIIGLELVFNNSATNSDSPKSAEALCSAGKQIISGWGSVETGQGLFSGAAVISYQRPSLLGTSFRVSAVEHEATAVNWRVSAYAVCADLIN